MLRTEKDWQQIHAVLASRHPQYTDSLREKIVPEDIETGYFNGSTQDYLKHEWHNMTPAEQKNAKKASNFYDAIQPYQIRKKYALPLIFDLRRGQYLASIGHINAGADDFNSAEGSLCPSIMIAYGFRERAQQIKRLAEQIPDRPATQISLPSALEKEAWDVKTSLNDLLYMYRKIKVGKGLNKALIETRGDKSDIFDTFAQMDNILKIPEKERFEKRAVAKHKDEHLISKVVSSFTKALNR